MTTYKKINCIKCGKVIDKKIRSAIYCRDCALIVIQFRQLRRELIKYVTDYFPNKEVKIVLKIKDKFE